MFFNRSIFLKLFISYLIILVLPIVLIGGFSYYKTVKIVDKQLQETNNLIVNNISKEYDNVFTNIDKIILYINEMPWIRNIINQNSSVDYYSVGADQIQKLVLQIGNYQLNVKQLDQIAVIIRNADMVFSSYEFSNINDYFSKYSFECEDFSGYKDIKWDKKNEVLLPKCLVSKYHAQAKDMMIIMKNIPLNDVGRYRACILIQVNLEKITEIFHNFKIGNKTIVQIANTENEMLLSSDNSFPPVIETISYSDKLQKNGNIKIGDQEYSYYFTSSTYNGFKYLVLADKKSVNSRTFAIQRFTIVIALISLVLGLLLSFAVARKNYKPIRNIFDKIFPNDNAMYKGKRVDELSLIEAAVNDLSMQNKIMKNSMDEYIPVFKNNLIFRLINGTEPETDVESHLKTCNIILNKPYFTVSCLEIDAMERLSEDENNEQDIISTLLIRYIEEYFQSIGDIGLVMSVDRFTYTMILNTSCDSFMEMKVKLKELVRRIREMLNNRYEIVAVSGIGRIHSSLMAVSTAYKEAMAALDCKFMAVDSEAICFDEKIEAKEMVLFSFAGKESQLFNLLQTGNYCRVEEYLDDMFDYQMKSKSIDSNSGIYMLYSMISVALRVLEDVGENYSDFIDFKKVSSFRNILDTEKYIKDLFNKVCKIVSMKKEKPNGIMINKIIKYIDSNYQLPGLSLTMISDELGLSNAYLSQLINEGLGKNFLSYVNQKRIDRAIELLKDESIPLKNLPSAIGFENDTNFRRVFKKYTAVTPSEYRDNWLRHKDGF